MAHIFEGESADSVWRLAAQAFARDSEAHVQGSRAGQTVELSQALFVIHDPRQRWVISRRPPINPAFAIAEVTWILQGRNDSAFVNRWNRMLPKFAGSGATYHGAYGYRLRRHFGIDQLYRALQVLQGNAESRQTVLQIWDVSSDFPGLDGSPIAPDIPCNVCSLLKIRDGALNWTQILRSNDLFLGVPYNLVQFTVLQEVFAGWLDVRVGTYSHLSDSLHVYQQDVESLHGTSPEEFNAQSRESLALPYDESRTAFAQLARLLEEVSSPSISEQEVRILLSAEEAPRPVWSLFAICAAEVARRRRWPEVMSEAAGACREDLLLRAWLNWLEKFAGSEGAHG